MLLLAAAVAMLATLVALRMLQGLAGNSALVDVPNERSSHVHPTPCHGGVAIATGVAVGIAVAVAVAGPLSPPAQWVLGAALLLAAVGFLDDLRGLRVATRLIAQILAAAAVVTALGGITRLPGPVEIALPATVGGLLSVLWLVGTTNFFNFMDGIDGLAGGQAVVSGCVLAMCGLLLVDAPDLARLGATVAAASAAFLFFNWSPARVFLGDSGSFLLGFFFAASPWIGPPETRETMILVVSAGLTLFLLDPVWTLASRWRRGERLTQAHREHLYQQLAAAPELHEPVALRLHAVAIVLSVPAMLVLVWPPLAWAVAVLMLLAFAIELLAAWRAPERTTSVDVSAGARSLRHDE